MWCSVCPFMIYGEWVQRIKRSLGFSLMPWPRNFGERVDGWAQFGGFAAILLWERLWHLNNNGALSASLLLLITAGAVVCSFLFERRFWCRLVARESGF